jgi:hemerythrin-like domain-containing protein
MSKVTPIEELEAEHRVIQKMVAGMSVLADQLEGGEAVDVSLLESIVVFLRMFADRCYQRW